MHFFCVYEASEPANSYFHRKAKASEFDGCVSPDLVSKILILDQRGQR